MPSFLSDDVVWRMSWTRPSAVTHEPRLPDPEATTVTAQYVHLRIQRDSTPTSIPRTHSLHPGFMASCCLDRGIRRQDRKDTGYGAGKITDGDVTELVSFVPTAMTRVGGDLTITFLTSSLCT